MTDDALKQWAESHATGAMRSPVAVRVLELLALRATAREVAITIRTFVGPESGAMNDHCKGILGRAADRLDEKGRT